MKFLTLFLAPFFWAITVSVKDFKPAFGKWEGTLTYLDYSSGKPYKMLCNITVSRDKTSPQQLVFAYEYPKEPKANGNDTVAISYDGSVFDKEQVIAKEKGRGQLTLITEVKSVDGNDRQRATIRHIYTITKRSFIIRKEVKFDGGEKWIIRNEYKMSR